MPGRRTQVVTNVQKELTVNGTPPPPPPAHAPPPPGPGPSSQLDLGQVLNEAWELFMRDAGLYVAAAATYLGILIITCGAAIFVWGPLGAGMVIMGFKARKGEQLKFDDCFAGFKLFGPTFLVTFVSGLLIVLGFALCVIPGIYLAIAWAFALPLVVDKKMDFWEAMQLSMRKVNENFVPVLLVILVLYAINSLGSSVALGFLITQPLMVLGINVAYEKLFGPLQPGPVVA